MRIVIGSLQCEGNSLTPIHTRFEDFDYAVGEAMYEKVQVTDFFQEKGCEIVPTIYAHALPGGAVVKKDFLRLAKELVDAIPTEGIDGIWLYLHGAMYVEKIGSGDTCLLQMVRDKVGYDIPISVAMDFHADRLLWQWIPLWKSIWLIIHSQSQKGTLYIAFVMTRKLLPAGSARSNVNLFQRRGRNFI